MGQIKTNQINSSDRILYEPLPVGMNELDKMETAAEGQNTMVGWLREHDPDFY